ncbi:MAG: hypothetical protein ABIW49_05055 [Knoellia sp.]
MGGALDRGEEGIAVGLLLWFGAAVALGVEPGGETWDEVVTPGAWPCRGS